MQAIELDEQLLIFRIGPVACCVAARDVDSIVNAQPLHLLPRQAKFIAGVLRYRDATVSVVNLFHKFALDTPNTPEEGRFIMAYTRHGITGFWVDEIIEITNDFEQDWSSAPAFTEENVFDKTLLWHDHFILKTDFDRLFSMKTSRALSDWAKEYDPDWNELKSSKLKNTASQSKIPTASNDAAIDSSASGYADSENLSHELMEDLVTRGTKFSQPIVSVVTGFDEDETGIPSEIISADEPRTAELRNSILESSVPVADSPENPSEVSTDTEISEKSIPEESILDETEFQVGLEEVFTDNSVLAESSDSSPYSTDTTKEMLNFDVDVENESMVAHALDEIANSQAEKFESEFSLTRSVKIQNVDKDDQTSLIENEESVNDEIDENQQTLEFADSKLSGAPESDIEIATENSVASTDQIQLSSTTEFSLTQSVDVISESPSELTSTSIDDKLQNEDQESFAFSSTEAGADDHDETTKTEFALTQSVDVSPKDIHLEASTISSRIDDTNENQDSLQFASTHISEEEHSHGGIDDSQNTSQEDTISSSSDSSVSSEPDFELQSGIAPTIENGQEESNDEEHGSFQENEDQQEITFSSTVVVESNGVDSVSTHSTIETENDSLVNDDNTEESSRNEQNSELKLSSFLDNRSSVGKNFRSKTSSTAVDTDEEIEKSILEIVASEERSQAPSIPSEDGQETDILESEINSFENDVEAYFAEHLTGPISTYQNSVERQDENHSSIINEELESSSNGHSTPVSLAIENNELVIKTEIVSEKENSDGLDSTHTMESDNNFDEIKEKNPSEKISEIDDVDTTDSKIDFLSESVSEVDKTLSEQVPVSGIDEIESAINLSDVALKTLSSVDREDTEKENTIFLSTIADNDDVVSPHNKLEEPSKVSVVETEAEFEVKHEEENLKIRTEVPTELTEVGDSKFGNDDHLIEFEKADESDIDSARVAEMSHIDEELISNTSGDEDLIDNREKKKEDAINRVLERIDETQEQRPKRSSFRLVASIIVAASGVFLVEHYDLMPDSWDVKSIQDIQLLSETKSFFDMSSEEAKVDVIVVDRLNLPINTVEEVFGYDFSLKSTQVDSFDELPPYVPTVVSEAQSLLIPSNSVEPNTTSDSISETVSNVEVVDQNLKPVEERITASLGEKTATENVPKGIETLDNNNLTSLPFDPEPAVNLNGSPLLDFRHYSVVKGDTLWGIAETYLNNPFRYNDLARWNGIKNPDLIYPGDDVKYIPPKTGSIVRKKKK